jgi:hypothetical protein
MATEKTVDVEVEPYEIGAMGCVMSRLVRPCPFCGKQHFHGGLGQRVPHCGAGNHPEDTEYVLVPCEGWDEKVEALL